MSDIMNNNGDKHMITAKHQKALDDLKKYLHNTRTPKRPGRIGRLLKRIEKCANCD